MINWHEIPFFRLLLPFIAGILLALYVDISTFSISAIALMALLFPGLWYLANTKVAFRHRQIFGWLLSVFLCVLGFFSSRQSNDLNQSKHFSLICNGKNSLIGEVKKVRKSNGKWRLILNIVALKSSTTNVQRCSGRLLAYLDAKQDEPVLSYGDKVLLHAKISSIAAAKNPKAFDFGKYMQVKNVHFQAFADKGQWTFLKGQEGFHFLRLADKLRIYCLGILKTHLKTGNEFAVASALLLGYRDEITEEVKTAYAKTGAMHVLAVSGLHVGLIYIGLGFFLGLIKIHWPVWKIAKPLLLLFAVWAFALVTGAAPSVLRASAMFSFLIVGQSLGSQSNIYNTLAASAFLLLCIRPFLLLDVGFQLSYLAVTGIVYLQPKIYRWIYIKNKFADYLWQLTTVSIAAQISTLPLSMYYFHQLPLYFWLSGLVVVPAAVVILSSGLLLFITNGLPLAGEVLGKLLYGIIKVVNQAIFLIEKLPASTIEGIWINLAIVFLMFASIGTIVIGIGKKKFPFLLSGLAILCIIAGSYSRHHWKTLGQRQIVIYHIPRHTAIDFIDGKKIYSIKDEKLSSQKLDFACRNYRWSRQTRYIREIKLKSPSFSDGNFYYAKGFIQFYDIKIALIGTQSKKWPKQPAFEIDHCFVMGNPKNLSLEQLPFCISGPVIIDASNNYQSKRSIKKQCRRLNIEFVDIYEKGAQVIQLAR